MTDAELTYPEVGATSSDDLPPGYRHVRREVTVGTGPETFAAVVAGVKSWHIHRHAGLRLRPTSPAPAAGAAFTATLRLLLIPLRIPCRVVWVHEQPSHYGYGFGTLPGHPEAGEEAFLVSLADDGRVWFTIRAFSRPVTWYARLGGPVTRWLQDRVTDRYVRAAQVLAQR